MRVTNDQWTPFLNDLKSRFSSSGRQKLLFQVIGELTDITMLNFGVSGIARPAEWPELKFHYATEYKYGVTVPTLELDDAMHEKRNPAVPLHLRDGFRHLISDNSASLTNISPYADAHQFGLGVPWRPFFPINRDGSSLTEYAEIQILEIVNQHFHT